ncbi:histidinol-phosphate transaminase [Pectinatus cerevisiiphilus]|uniref:Histidinol-phosphate aminotransferase n=1 Tax=Pectinatus cerevisiiphilus TaxID=86956 RepID=A0A4R3KBR8_9FIRM|nr:histidinol-phosphate transaminase [Pectinatus cerevisiiphilus]TCS80465.1 histidinol-phosphate aminotransferase [Pectinatus cerevisiiphilus]
MLKYRAEIKKLPTYDVIERDWNIKINANECNMNLPPIVEERVMGRLSRLAFNRYPNTETESLAEQLAAAYHVQRRNILLANGSSEILEKMFFCFGGRNHKIVYPQPSFSMYKIYAELSNSISIPFDLDENYCLDAEKFVATVNDNKAHLAVICAPNNPTGTHIPLADIEYIAKNINCAFVVDEAYIEFDGRSAMEIWHKYPHMIIARTFSKAYGLAGARVGYMIADEKITEITGKVFMPYHLNILSAVTADIVYQMRHEYEPRIAMMRSERDRIAEQLKKMSVIQVYPSATNFVLMKYDKAVGLNEYLANIGIGVRSFGDAPRLKNCIRVSAGLREENDTFMKAVKDFVETHTEE